MTAARPANPTVIASRRRSNPQSSLRAEGEAIQGLQKKDWIASSAFGLLAMTAARPATPTIIASRRRSNPQSSLRAEGEAIHSRHCEPKAKQSRGCKRKTGLLRRPLASSQRRRGLWPPRNDGGTAGNPNRHCEKAKQSPVVIASRRRSNPGAAKKSIDSVDR